MVHQSGQSVHGNPDEKHDVFIQEQNTYWQKLRSEFQRYKDEFRVTNLELANGLDISRQPLVDFMQGSRDDLPIGRGQLKRLWHHLTNSEEYKGRKLSQDGKLSREVLSREGVNRLLRSAGFLADGEEEDCVYLNKNRKQQIQRIITGLSNIPTSNFGDFVDLIDSMEKELIEQAFNLKKQSIPENTRTTNYYEMSEDEIDIWIHDWIQKNIFADPSSEVISKFKKAIYRLIRFGKYKFEDSEIFELYLSIRDKNGINQKEKIDRFESNYKIKISQCQFSTLTFSLSEFIRSDSEIKEEIERAAFEVESFIRYPSSNQAYLRTQMSDVVIEALVSCILLGTGDNKGEEETIHWRYSSSATHFENMLTAIYQGMGCENDLELVNFSLRSLGKRSESLIKSSITLSNCNSTHQGIWVDESSIFGTSRSMFIAVRDWLLNSLSEDEACLHYYQICKEMAAINHSLNYGRKTLNDYVIRRFEYPRSIPTSEYIKKNVLDKIKWIEEKILYQSSKLKKMYGLDIERKKCMANLICARSSHIEGDLLTAKKYYLEAKRILDNPEVGKDKTLQNFLSSEEMLHQFYSGNQEFFEEKRWREKIDINLKELQTYIYSRQDDCEFKKYCGRLDLYVYRSASELFARMGRLDLCLSGEDDISHVEKAASRLLMAAYCSAKIGDRQRASHWIANASRVYSRLGFGDKSLALANLAEEIVQVSMDNRYSSRYKDAIMAEVLIARAEKYLLIDGDMDNALRCFLIALRGAAYLGFSRLMADSLYGIGRASKEMHSQVVSGFLDEIFSDGERTSNKNRWLFQKDLKGKKAKKIVLDVVHFINDLEGEGTWSFVSEQFKEQSKKIWHTWAVTMSMSKDAKHPIEDLIDSERYLCRLC